MFVHLSFEKLVFNVPKYFKRLFSASRGTSRFRPDYKDNIAIYNCLCLPYRITI